MAAVLACSCAGFNEAEADVRGPLDETKELAPFIEEMTAEYGFDESELRRIIGDARILPEIIKAISTPAEAKPWYEYRPIFLTETRISKGVGFWSEHQASLARAEESFGVPAEIIVAIIGVETLYGEHAGRVRVLDSLVTLGFRYPRRAGFFRSELKQFLLLCRDEDLDPLVLKGSYAGAMGVPQFISSSYRSYAVDFDGDGRRNLISSPADAIGSVANYLKRHGWQPDGTIAVSAQISGNGYKDLLELGIKPKVPLDDLSKHGVKITGDPVGEQRGALIELELRSAKEHWVVMENFYAITRYNHSKLYAMAVTQLAQKILSRYQEQSG
jgi:membrane-bound lytic murein transglycosylase B